MNAGSVRAAELRVLEVTPVFAPSVGGVETAVREVTRRLVDRVAHVEVLTADASHELPREEEMFGARVERVPAWPKGGDQLFAPGVMAKVRGGRWDVIHLQCYHTLVAPLAMMAAARARIPYVLTFHGGGHPSKLRSSLRDRQMQVLRPLLMRASALIATAEWEVERYSTLLGIPERKFVVIPNGGDLPPTLGEPVRGEGTTLVSIGRLEGYKGHHRAIAALPHVMREVPDARLWIAGTGPAEEELAAQARELGVADRVQIRAERDRAAYAAQLKGATVGLLLSEFETHPMAAVEALKLGLPMLVGEDSAGLSELAAKGYARGIDNGLPAERHAEAIVELIRAPPPSQDIAMLTWDETVDALLDLFEDAHARRAPRRAGQAAERGPLA